MITTDMINRINELAKKQKENLLTPEEKEEQTKLRRLYIDSIKNQVHAELKARAIEPKSQHSHGPDCSCHKHHH